MDSTICQSVSAYVEISCSGSETTSAVATPIIQIGMMLIVIIILATVGIIMKKNAKKVAQVTVNMPVRKVVEKFEQDKLLNQKL
ncbi:hypothetical protein FWC31_02235 [Candidatus Saccharibacteria bacterium]|nr:hypothetical protein [Candidatus Saccharibacteria bacterium]